MNPAFTIRFRYKEPDTRIPRSLQVFDYRVSFEQSTEHMRFTGSAAGFGMLLRNSKFKGTLTYEKILQWTAGTVSYDPYDRELSEKGSGYVEQIRRRKERV